FIVFPIVLFFCIFVDGILIRIFTAIYASVIFVVYSLFLALIYHRTMNIKQLPKVMVEAVEMTGVIMLLMAASSSMSFAMSFIGIPDALCDFVLSFSDNPIIILLIINLLLLLIG